MRNSEVHQWLQLKKEKRDDKISCFYFFEVHSCVLSRIIMLIISCLCVRLVLNSGCLWKWRYCNDCIYYYLEMKNEINFILLYKSWASNLSSLSGLPLESVVRKAFPNVKHLMQSRLINSFRTCLSIAIDYKNKRRPTY